MVEYDFVKVPIVDIVNQIILYAAQHRASDIHFDPLEDALMVRMRVDGDLQNHSLVPKVYERNLITRIKLVSAMNITETRLPQDGAIKGRIGGRDLDMRVSILPTNEGEKCVIRILDFQKGLSGLDGLGFTPKNFAKIEKMLAVPNGIILVTGATGSGKSTTTYSMLSALNKEETNVITVEDPIEMNIEGINQVQVNSEIGMTFAAALRSILRQDPNVILIGEMRDEETAQIAVRAAITGHLVLSTIHTNNALATLERLFDMGVERYMVATSVVGIISQRLARTLCDKCKKLRPTTKYERYMFARVLHKKVKETYEPVGCSECHGGFKGRIAIHEVLYISEHLRDMISDESVDKEQLRDDVYGNGDTTTLLQDALQKVIMGHTTFQEIYRVVDIDVDLDNAIKADIGINEAGEEVIDVEEDADWMTFDGTFDDELELIDIENTDENDLPTLDTSIINVDEFLWQFNKKLDASDPEFVKFFILEDKKIMDEEVLAKENERKLFREFIEQYDAKLTKAKMDKLFKEFLSQYDDQFGEEKKLSKEQEDEAFRKFLAEYDNKVQQRILHEKELEAEIGDLIDIFDNNSLITDLGLVEDPSTIKNLDDIVKGQKDEEISNNEEVVLYEKNTLDNIIGGYGAVEERRNNILDLTNVEFNYKEILDLIDAYSDKGPSIQDVVDDTIGEMIN
ncbi:MAG: hypothetical protein E7162_04345 [Firmicutes bacterium]|nr:hypothetical protein [Bacillota bacterium]